MYSNSIKMNGDIDINGIKIINVNSKPIKINGDIDINGIKITYIHNN